MSPFFKLVVNTQDLWQQKLKMTKKNFFRPEKQQSGIFLYWFFLFYLYFKLVLSVLIVFVFNLVVLFVQLASFIS